MQRSPTLYRQELPSPEPITASPSSSAPTSPTLERTRSSASTSSARSRPMSTRQNSRMKPPKRTATTIDSVRHKTCFICYTSEDDEPTSKARWIHACRCTLVAHESCLLQWVASAQERKELDDAPLSQREIRCPQCNTPYIIRQKPNLFLDVLEKCEQYYNRASVRLLVIALGTGIAAASGAYGLLATRIFVGPAMAQRLFDRKWPWTYYLNLPLVAPLLIASRTSLVDNLFTMMPFALFSLPLDADDDSSNDLYPPGLNTTIVLLPIFRFLYGKARRNVRSFVFARSRQLEAPPAVEVGPPPIVEVVMPEGQPVPEAAAAAGEAPREDPLPDIHISVRQIARLAIGALAFPLLSSTMGNALLYLATPLDAHHSQPLPKAGWLRIGLGLGEPEVFRAAMGWPMLPGKMPSKGWLSMGAVAVGPLFSTRIDPVWWRNAIGGAVIVVCKDVLGLLRAVLERRRLDSRHIQPVPVSRDLEMDFGGP